MRFRYLNTLIDNVSHAGTATYVKSYKPGGTTNRVLLAALLTLVTVCLPAPSGAQTGPVIQLQPFLSGLSQPVLITHARDGSNRLFIVEQTGLIKVLQPGSTTPTTFLDLTSKRVLGGEQGVLGLAFHPDYESNCRFFVNYTRAGDGATVIAEYLASPTNPNVALTAERIILTIAQPFANHNGGMIEFGPDGYLYIGMGDGGSANDPGNRAQNINDLLGKMLRIDIDQTAGAVNYVSPSSNPFFGPAAGRDEIFSVGMRNPWRFSFDRLTGQIYAGDVGQGQIEEIDIITSGANYGWRVFEGTRCTGNDAQLCNPGNYTAPITEYNHSGGRCSVTGGYVYRGSSSSLPYGSYLFGDYCTGEVFLFHNGVQTRLLDTAINISSFGEDQNGELYVVGLGGTIHRVINPVARSTVSVSAANYRGDLLAPNSIVAAFGSELAASASSATLPLPMTLAGTQVRVTDAAGTPRFASLFYVSPSQVNYVMPADTVAGRADVVITSVSGAVSSGTVEITSVAPGIFSANSDGIGTAAAYVTQVHNGAAVSTYDVARFDAQQGRFVAQPINMSPTNDDFILSIFGTGIRNVTSLSAVSVAIGGANQQVEFAGPHGTFVALDQINVRLSRALAGRGVVEIDVIADGKSANPVTIQIL
jgi:uncharacterized protein (TIGR03437 family)